MKDNKYLRKLRLIAFAISIIIAPMVAVMIAITVASFFIFVVPQTLLELIVSPLLVFVVRPIMGRPIKFNDFWTHWHTFKGSKRLRRARPYSDKNIGETIKRRSVLRNVMPFVNFLVILNSELGYKLISAGFDDCVVDYEYQGDSVKTTVGLRPEFGEINRRTVTKTCSIDHFNKEQEKQICLNQLIEDLVKEFKIMVKIQPFEN